MWVERWLFDGWLQWAWLVLAVIFLIAEVFTVGFFLFCFGVGAAVAAGAAYLGAPPLVQFGAFLAASAATLVGVRPLVNRLSNPDTHTVGIDRVLGQSGIVLETIDPARGCGVVRVGHERWSADAADGVPIAGGAAVVVVGVEGTHLQVRPAV